MLDLNNADKQSDFAGVIPKNSMVKLRLEIRPPAEEKKSHIHPALFVSKNDSNNHCLDLIFHVVSGTFEKNKIYSNMVVEGSVAATAISAKSLRGIVEGARGINQDDFSDQAQAARGIRDYWEFDNMEFAAKIGYAKIDSDSKYVNNKIQIALRPGVDEDYPLIMGGGEKITDEPIPEIPSAGENNGPGGPGNGSGQTYNPNPNKNSGNGGGNSNQTYNPNQNNGPNQNGGNQTYNPNQNNGQNNGGNQNGNGQVSNSQGGNQNNGQSQNNGGQPNWTKN